MPQLAKIVTEIGRFCPSAVAIDEVGIGAGVASRLAEIMRADDRGIMVHRWNAGKAALLNERWANKKTELLMNMHKAMIDCRSVDARDARRLVARTLGRPLEDG